MRSAAILRPNRNRSLTIVRGSLEASAPLIHCCATFPADSAARALSISSSIRRERTLSAVRSCTVSRAKQISSIHCRNTRTFLSRRGSINRYAPRHISQAMKPENRRPKSVAHGTVAPDRRELAEHLVAVRTDLRRLAAHGRGDVASRLHALAHRMLRSGGIGLALRARHGGAITARPYALVARHRHRFVDDDAASFFL